jgi:hypothetical protein
LARQLGIKGADIVWGKDGRILAVIRAGVVIVVNFVDHRRAG